MYKIIKSSVDAVLQLLLIIMDVEVGTIKNTQKTRIMEILVLF